MPYTYAHHRFGTLIIPMMPADVRGPILRNRAMFDMGLHGPDFLFFHQYLKTTPLFRLGTAYHDQSGKEFFTRACAHLQQHPSEAAFAYLHGLLGHYCLDSQCHPFVYSMTDGTGLGHGEMETEFDRFLLTLDGCKKPHEVNSTRQIKLKKKDYSIISGFYPDVSEKDLTTCIQKMMLSQTLLTIPTAPGHLVVEKVAGMISKTVAGKVMSVGPNPRCDHLNSKMLELYDQALAKYPACLEQLSAHMAYGEPLGELFVSNFNRG